MRVQAHTQPLVTVGESRARAAAAATGAWCFHCHRDGGFGSFPRSGGAGDGTAEPIAFPQESPLARIADKLPDKRSDKRAKGHLEPVDASGVDERPGMAADDARVEIPTRRRRGWAARAVLVRERGAAAESFRHFAVKVSRVLAQRNARTLAITSASRAEGKTTVSCNLGLALASLRAERRIALVEFDLRRPRVGAGLGVSAKVGVEEVLAGRATAADARLGTQFETLDLFLAGEPQLRAHELLSSKRLKQFIAALREAYDLVVLDTAPVLLVPDSPMLINDLDACVLVTRRGRTRKAALEGALDLLPPEKVIGAFMNEASLPVRSRHYTYYTDA